MRRHLPALLGLAVVVTVASGCASVVRGEPAGDPVRAPAGQVVFQVANDGISVAGASDFRRPGLTVYGDGSAYRVVPQQRYERPVVLERGRVEAAELSRLAWVAERSGLFEARQPMMGRPGITDMPSTSVTYRPGRGAGRTVTAYALSYTGDDPDLTAVRRANRAAMRHLLEELDHAFVRPTGNPTWTPDRVDVSSIDRYGATSTIAWPGPALATLLRPTSLGNCGVLSGSDARRVYESALRNDTASWREAGRVVTLVVRPLLPGEAGCRR